MLTIRFTRKGRKNQPFYRVVVIDKKRSAKGGRAVEVLGYVDPLTKKKDLNKDRILHWIKNGAQPSDSIHNLLVTEKIIEAKKVKQFSVTKRAKAEAVKAAEAAAVPAPETPVEAVAPETPAVPEAPAPEAPKEEVKPAEEPKAEETPKA